MNKPTPQAHVESIQWTNPLFTTFNLLPTWTSFQCLSSHAMQEQNEVSNFTALPGLVLPCYEPDYTTISYAACTVDRYTKYLYGNSWWPLKLFMVFLPVKKYLKFNTTCICVHLLDFTFCTCTASSNTVKYKIFGFFLICWSLTHFSHKNCLM